ncbi:MULTISPECIES: hypothetical protein, partial [unclassified Mesorhizobium]
MAPFTGEQIVDVWTTPTLCRSTANQHVSRARASAMTVVCVKFCKMGQPRCWSCGLAQSELLVLAQVVHVDVSVGLHP